MAKEWLITPPFPDCPAVARQWDVPEIVAQLLMNRGVTRDERAGRFLAPRLQDLHPPALLHGAPQAAAVIVEAVRSGTKIVIYGDYDVDGTCGVAILWHVLKMAGGNVGFYVPHRIEEGYGLNATAARSIVDEGAGLLVSVDCGISAHEVVVQLRRAGVKVIITDHHALDGGPPPADAVVHPGIGESYPNPDLCGAGVAFKLAWAAAQLLSEGAATNGARTARPDDSPDAQTERVSPRFRGLLVDLLPLAALGTIADVVPLRGENRIIATHGLRTLSTCALPGVRALIEQAGWAGGAICGYDVGFKLAPRINAAGRMGHARLAVELFTGSDGARAREIAAYLESQNRLRRAEERRVFSEAREIVEEKGLARDATRALVLAKEGWHAGVIGIVAARLVERFHRPALLIALTNGEGQGSARGVANFHVFEALAECRELLVSFGGHAMAGGIRIAAEKVDDFAGKFVDVANNRLTSNDLEPKLRLDAEVSLESLTLETAEAIRMLEPFGTGNPRPILASGWLELAAEPRRVGKQQDHLQVSFTENGLRMKAIGFGMGNLIDDLRQHRRCRAAFEPIINDFNGRRSVEMQLIDLKFPQTGRIGSTRRTHLCGTEMLAPGADVATHAS